MTLGIILYNIGWLILWPLIIAWSKLHNKNWYSRRIKFNIGKLPRYADKNSVWVHALSMGEVLSAIPLVQELKELGYRIIFSSTTESGFERAKSYFHNSEVQVVLMPIDTPWNVRKIYRLPIKGLIIVETDVWPNLLWFANKYKIPIFLVNARMRPKSFKNYLFMKKCNLSLFQLFNMIFPASESDAKYYRELVKNKNRVKFCGNLKWDYVYRKRSSIYEIKELRRMLNVPETRPVWVAGSIHEGEEEIVMKAHKKICSLHNNCLLIIAPRKLEHVNRIIECCESYGLSYKLRSENWVSEKTNVLILNTFGELLKFYGLGWCAFVGGSLVEFGGHNLMEPAVYNIEICWGPHVFNFIDMAKEIERSRGGKVIYNSGDLAEFVLDVFSKRLSEHHDGYYTPPYKHGNISKSIADIISKYPS